MQANRFLAAAFVLALCPQPSFAEPNKEVASSAPATQTIEAAFKYRAEIAATVGESSMKPAAALSALRARGNAMGFGFSPEIDFGSAVLDIGHRLVAAGHLAEAEPFFSAAEESLGDAIAATPDEDAVNKSQLLEQRAYIRDRYLNKSSAADADLQRAIELQPDNPRLKRKRDQLPQEKTGRKAGGEKKGGE